MKLTPKKLQQLLEIISLNHKVFGVQVVGEGQLTFEDHKLFKKYGINLNEIKQKYPELLRSFHWGRLSQLLRNKAPQVAEKDFMEYLYRGQYIPLNQSEKYALNYVENKCFNHIKNLEQRIGQTVTNIFNENDPNLRISYEEAIRDSVKRAVIERKGVQSIVSDIGHKMNDWERDLGRIAETELNDAMQYGRAEQIKREDGADTEVYKTVYPGACRHCIRLYTTRGIGSKPIIFKLSELVANGTNIGKKVADWVATVGSTHPWCRCQIEKILKGYVWDQDKKSFVLPKIEGDKYGARGLVKVTVGDKTFTV